MRDLALMLQRAAAEIEGSCRVAAAAGAVEPVGRGWTVVGELDAIVEGLLRRVGLVGVEAGAMIEPRPPGLTGVAGSSDVWQFGTGAPAERSVRSFMWGSEWSGRAAARSVVHHGWPGTFTAAALAAEGHANVWARAGMGGLHLGLEAYGGLHVAQLEYGFEGEYVEVASEMFVGTEGTLLAEVDLNPDGGDISIVGGLDTFVGLAAVGAVAAGPEAARITAAGEAGIGFGLDIDGGATIADGVLEVDLGASAFLGVGGGVDLSLELDLAAIGSAALEAVDTATEWLASLWG